MRLVHGHVVDGRVVVPGEQLREGVKVAVIVEDAEAPVLSSEDIAELSESREALRRGEGLTSDEVLMRLLAKR